MNLSQYTVLSFDCYGTLIDWDAGLTRHLHAIAPEVDADHLLSSYAEHEARIERESPTTRYQDVVARAAMAVAEELGQPIASDAAAAIGASVGSWPPFPDSAAALSRLRQRCTLAALSNTDRQNFVGSSALLGNPFHHAILAEDVGAYKPDARIFAALTSWLRENGFDERQHLHVAQSLYHDHAPAKALGWTTVWINRRHGLASEGASGPKLDVVPDMEFPNMASFADAMTTGVR